MTKKLIESGHFYISKGVTEYSLIGKGICDQLKTEKDSTMLFIDDVHGLNHMFPEEREAKIVEIDSVRYQQAFDMVVLESHLVKRAQTMITLLGKAKTSKSGTYISGIKLLDTDSYPTCVMLDVALTIMKTETYDCKHLINILPEYYLPQQQNLKKIISKFFPNIRLDIILFTSASHYRYL